MTTATGASSSKSKKPKAGGTGSTSSTTPVSKINHNEDITKILAELGQSEKNSGQIFKANAYFKAVRAISGYHKRLESGAEAKKLEGVGDKIAKKVDEILKTGKLQRLERDKADETLQAINLISKVSGIGPVAAKKFVSEGIDTIQKLRQNKAKLNHHQQIGLKYFEEIEERIPRSEMVEWEKGLVSTVKSIDTSYIATICGSYRRGLPSSGDIDLLVTHPSYLSSSSTASGKNKKARGLLEPIVKKLRGMGVLVDELSFGDVKYMG
ncbi:hypothetical protein HK102_005733, partial [Quaeritorhiza haematococci]